MPKRFSASSAAQLMTCPGSANLELAIPGWKEPVRDDMAGAKGVGTRLHEVLQPFHAMTPTQLYNYAETVYDFSKLHHTRRKSLAAKQTEFDAWMDINYGGLLHGVPDTVFKDLLEFPPKLLRYVADVADYMGDLATTYGLQTRVRAEENLIAEWLPSKGGTTPDVTIVQPKRLEVVDYKTGAIPVSPVENSQLLFYAACLLHMAPEAEEFTLHILQPGNLDSWTAPISYLTEWMSLAIEADRRILRKDLTLAPGDHCTFCPANPHTRGDKGSPLCPAKMEQLYPTFIQEDELFKGLHE